MNYGSVYLGSWEIFFFENSKTKPITYFRFVDVVCGLWSDGLDSLKDCHRVANSIHPRIQVDLRYSTEKLEFLNVLTIIEHGRIKTDLFTKPTEKHLYLHSKASHLEYMKSSIPYRLGFRVKRICSGESSYKIQKMK